MSEAKIHTQYHGCSGQWTAVSDNYDGAPDALPEHSMVGHGNTEAEAIQDLRDQENE